jgi:hypothetical protein
VDAFEAGPPQTRPSARVDEARRPGSPKRPKSPGWIIKSALASHTVNLTERHNFEQKPGRGAGPIRHRRVQGEAENVQRSTL